MMKKFLSQQAPVVTVSASKAQMTDWNPQYKVTGSVRTVKGVNVTTELAGMIREIVFTPGAFVKKGDLLVQLDIDADVAQLKALEAKAKFDKITWERNSAQYKFGAVSKETLDANLASYKSSDGSVGIDAVVSGLTFKDGLLVDVP